MATDFQRRIRILQLGSNNVTLCIQNFLDMSCFLMNLLFTTMAN